MSLRKVVGWTAAAAILPVIFAFTFPNVQEIVAGTTYTTATTNEVLVLASAATEIPSLPNRAGIEIQNLGPNAIYCAIGGTGTTAVVTKSRQIAASGGTWSLSPNHRTSIWCRAATADQVTGAATIVSQFAR